MVVAIARPQIRWEAPPDDFVLADDPVDNVNQPAIAAALTESLELAQRLTPQSLITTNYGLCAQVDGKTVVKAPDWAYILVLSMPRETIQRSYTPQLQGDLPTVVMEFLSDTDGGEHSTKPTYPPGKWFFYEQILQVPNYVLFDPQQGTLEVYRLDEGGHYQLRRANDQQCYWLEELQLFLGVWQGTRENRAGYWLRWWDAQDNLLLWGMELVALERQAKQTALERLALLEQRLRESGLEL
ncbi:Uma2 family endonuclease [Synechocystis sp. LKSZ1]|uniref:Uma2 family endonuclease n=1 Tax=Synechocystis sp. LKSZ1 TaxID=3144951 RepID=UPI00336BD21A